MFSRAAIGAPKHHQRSTRCIVGKDDIARPLLASFSNPQIPSRPHDGNVFPIPTFYARPTSLLHWSSERHADFHICNCPKVSNPLFEPDGICFMGHSRGLCSKTFVKRSEVIGWSTRQGSCTCTCGESALLMANYRLPVHRSLLIAGVRISTKEGSSSMP